MKYFIFKDIIFIMLIVLIFGVFFVGIDVIYVLFYFVIGFFVNEVLFGFWIMVGLLVIVIFWFLGMVVIGRC